MIILTPAVLSVLYASVLYFCICICAAQLSMFHMERHTRNMLIIIIIITIIINFQGKTWPTDTPVWIVVCWLLNIPAAWQCYLRDRSA